MAFLPQNDNSNRMQNEYNDPAFQQFAMNMNLAAYATAAPVAQYPAMASPSQPTYDQASTSANLVHHRRRSGGGRRMSPDDLIPLDAPTQPRRYLAPSATSKKEVPSYYNKRPSYSRLSDDEQEDELNEEPPAPNATDQEKIEWKRRQNTLAARRSRKRKLLQQQHLEQAVEDLTREKETWRTRALTSRQLLISHSILCPDFDESSTQVQGFDSFKGGDRRMSPDDLISLDAPTQPRQYLAPSAPLKKDVPSYYNKRLSYGQLSDDEQEDELDEEPPAPNATDQDKIEWKRRQNALAARKSRKRKLLQQQHLEQAVEDLTREKEIWRTRALTLRQLLISHDIPCPNFDNPSTQVQDFGSFNTSPALRVSEQVEHFDKPMDEALLITRARSALDCASGHCQSDTFVARDALDHVNTHRDDILKPLGVQHALTAFILAGFNEAYIREGIGLLQEIHIVTREDLEFDESALAGVGKACSPFPSVIFMPSGKCLQPPLYNQDGQGVPFSVLGGSVCKLRHAIAADKDLSLANSGTILDRHGGTSRHAAGGNAPISQEALPTTNQLGGVNQRAGASQNASNQPTSVEGDEQRSFHAQDSTQGVHARESPLQRLDPDVVPQDPPEPDNGTSTKRLRNIYLKLLLAIRQSEEESSFGQNIQLQAAFDFQLDPGKSATVQFTELVCSGATASSRQHQPHYSHKYLKVLVDVQSDSWKPICCLPQRTPAGQREIKDVDTNKSAKQGGIKFKAALAPEANVEGTLTSENSKASERVRFISGITQENWLGEYTWGFDVDDEREQRQGLQLSAERLPKLSLDYLRDARHPSETDIPKELTVEISAFWSLNPPTSNGWLWWQSQPCPPQYSNLVHSVRVDLPADMDCDGHFVGEQQIGGGLPESRKVKTLSPLGIVVSTGIQAPGNRAPEAFPRWLPRLS